MLLAIGTIIIINKDFTKDSDKYKSKVIDITDNHVMVDYPTHIKTGRTAYFVDGTQLIVTFIGNNKISYAYRTEVSGHLLKGVPMLKLSYPGDDQLIKIQRREFVRVDSAIDVAVLKNGDIDQFVAQDISAGGLALNLTDKKPQFDQKDKLTLLIVLPFMNKDIKYIRVDATVVRIWEKSGSNIASLKFDELNADDQQRIVRFCFERQLELRNKS